MTDIDQMQPGLNGASAKCAGQRLPVSDAISAVVDELDPVHLRQGPVVALRARVQRGATREASAEHVQHLHPCGLARCQPTCEVDEEAGAVDPAPRVDVAAARQPVRAWARRS